MSFHASFARFALMALLCALGSCSRSRSRQAGIATHGSSALLLAGQAFPAGRAPLRPEEITVEVEQRAKEILDAHADAPVGTEVSFAIGGRNYVARIEEHYHEPGGPRKPWGRHRGVTVYRAD